MCVRVGQDHVESTMHPLSIDEVIDRQRLARQERAKSTQVKDITGQGQIRLSA